MSLLEKEEKQQQMKILPASTQAWITGHNIFLSSKTESIREKYYGTLQETWNILRAGIGVEDADFKEYQDKDGNSVKTQILLHLKQ